MKYIGTKIIALTVVIAAVLCRLTTFNCVDIVYGSQKFDDLDYPELLANYAILVDDNTGTVLYEKNAYTRTYPASLTKIMTAILVLENLDPQQIVTASFNAIDSVPNAASTLGIKQDEQMSVENLLYCMLMPSANEAANILAEAVAGSIENFCVMMNERSAELGCIDTHFSNANGLHKDDHYTCAYDMYLITKHALTFALFDTIVNTKDYTVPATNKASARYFFTTNNLISKWRSTLYYYADARGVKTGYTSNSGYCLISSAENSTVSLIGVVMDSKIDPETNLTGSFTDMTALLKWGLSSFKREVVLKENQTLGEASVKDGYEADHILLAAPQNISCIVPRTYSAGNIKYVISSADLKAPIEIGDVIGQADIIYNGAVLATVPLTAKSAVSLNPADSSLDAVSKLFGSKLFLMIVIFVLSCVFIYIVAVLIMTLRRKKRQQKNKMYYLNKRK